MVNHDNNDVDNNDTPSSNDNKMLDPHNKDLYLGGS